MLLALEDFRLRPANQIARLLAEVEMGIDADTANSEELDAPTASAPQLVMHEPPLTNVDVEETQVEQPPAWERSSAEVKEEFLEPLQKKYISKLYQSRMIQLHPQHQQQLVYQWYSKKIIQKRESRTQAPKPNP